jgi:argininosuccinate synthase
MIISKAMDDILTLKFPRSLIENKVRLDQRWATLACEGHWFSKEKQAIEAYNQSISREINGEVTYGLTLGTFTLAGVQLESRATELIKRAA